MKRPVGLTVFAVATIVVGGLGASHALSLQLAPLFDHHDTFVEQVRDSLDAQRLPGLTSDERATLGLELGEREWSRRGVAIPLGLANLVTSFLLFAGAIEALRGRPWGHGAWEWAARLSVPYTLVATALAVVGVRDLAGPMAASLHAVSRGGPVDGGAFAELGVLLYEGLAVAWGVSLIGFYIACVVYLRRPSIKSLFPPAPAAK
jgi:hypothetical protein